MDLHFTEVTSITDCGGGRRGGWGGGGGVGGVYTSNVVHMLLIISESPDHS